MLKKLGLPGLALGFIVLSSACKKQEPLPITNELWVSAVQDTASIVALQRELALTVPTKEVVLGDKVVIDLDGGRLVLESLKDSATSVAVNSGVATASLFHVNKAGELIRLNHPTETQEAPLRLEGGLYYRIVQNGRPLLPRVLTASLPRLTTGNLPNLVYYGYPVPEEHHKVWVPITPSDATPRVVEGFNRQPGETTEPAEPQFTFMSYNNPFRSVACLKPVSYAGTVTQAEIKLPSSFNPQNTEVFIQANEGLSVYRAAPFFQNTSFRATFGLPEGFTGRVVSLSKVRGEYYFGLYTGTLPTIGFTELTPEVVTLDEMKQRLEDL